MIDVTHPYNYRRAVLAENAAAAATGATPTLREITAQHAAAQGKIATQSQALTTDTAWAEKKLAEQSRQFNEKIAADREQLNTWNKQNKWATKIMLANLGVQALGIPAQQKTLEMQNAIQQNQKDQWRKSYDLQALANSRAETAAEQLQRQQAAQHEQTMAAIRQQARRVPIYGQWQNTLPADDDTT